MVKKGYEPRKRGIVVRLGSRYVNANTNNVNFGVRKVNNGNVNNYNLFNSNGNANNNNNGVRPAASKKLWYS